MKYFRVSVSNGLCGCDEEWITTTEKDDLDFYDDIFENYTYGSGYAGIEYDDDMWTEYDEEDGNPEVGYEIAISDNTYWEEITEEEFVRLRDEKGWDER